MKLICRHLSELDQVAAQIVDFAGDYRVWLLEGDMGAGKTTLTKAICKQLGVHDTVNSPTFGIVNEYHSAEGEVLYHFDFYRLRGEAEALDIGCDEYFDSGSFCFIEWSSRIPSLIPPQHLKIEIQLGNNRERLITLSKHAW